MSECAGPDCTHPGCRHETYEPNGLRARMDRLREIPPEKLAVMNRAERRDEGPQSVPPQPQIPGRRSRGSVLAWSTVTASRAG